MAVAVKAAPATPWRARKAMSRGAEGAKPQSSDVMVQATEP